MTHLGMVVLQVYPGLALHGPQRLKQARARATVSSTTASTRAKRAASTQICGLLDRDLNGLGLVGLDFCVRYLAVRILVVLLLTLALCAPLIRDNLVQVFERGTELKGLSDWSEMECILH